MGKSHLPDKQIPQSSVLYRIFDRVFSGCQPLGEATTNIITGGQLLMIIEYMITEVNQLLHLSRAPAEIRAVASSLLAYCKPVAPCSMLCGQVRSKYFCKVWEKSHVVFPQALRPFVPTPSAIIGG